MDEIRRAERRDQLIGALMTAEDYDFDAAEKIVEEFERSIICPRCGAEIGTDRAQNELSGTIWDGECRARDRQGEELVWTASKFARAMMGSTE